MSRKESAGAGSSQAPELYVLSPPHPNLDFGRQGKGFQGFGLGVAGFGLRVQGFGV